MTVTPRQIAFQQALEEYYGAHGRHGLPWRLPEPDGSYDPYKILVSELMLQQTQVRRVVPKYQELLVRFPTVEALAGAELGEVLKVWGGLGYNRRAKYLWQAAGEISRTFHGHFPSVISDLVSLSGVGKNTAGAILAYAFNQPVLFVETNIRTVYIHHFFNDQIDVADSTILELLTQTLDREKPREFYWALMDYGSYLKQTVGNLSKFSKNYSKQSTFHGSRRQLRGQILRTLSQGRAASKDLHQQIPDERLDSVLADLLQENLIQKSGQTYHL